VTRLRLHFVALVATLISVPAGAAPFSICYDFRCKSQAQVTLSEADWAVVGAAFGTARSAAEERRSIARAVAALERLIGPRTGTALDKGGNRAGSGMPGQMDCIDESRNTTTYLQALAHRDLLRWHRVDGRAKRTTWVLFAHWTAVISEPGGESYAVDSWPRDNGELPYVQPLSDWKRHRDPPQSAALL